MARSLLGILLAVPLALEWGSPGAAIAAGGSAAIAGATALQDRPYGRLPLVLGVSVGMGVAVFIGSLTAPHGLLFVVAVAIWSAGAGLVWAINANAGMVAAAATALMVSCSHQPSTLADATTTALLAIGGGLTQAVLVAAWPRQRWQAQRDALADAYRAVATGTRELAADPAATLDVSPLINLRDALTPTERQARRRPPAFRGLYGLPERIAMTVTALRSNSQDRAVGDTLTAAADALDAIGGHGRGTRRSAESALDVLDVAISKVPITGVAYAHRLQTQLREAAALRFTGTAEPTGTVGCARRSLREQLSWDSPILRHAVRLAGAAAVATAAAAITGMEQGYWIALTAVIVLRPETAHTYTRCLTRILGTTAGITLATAVTVVAHPGGFASAVLAVLSVGVAYAVSGLGYVPLTAALAAAIVFLVDIAGTAHSETLGERLLATAIGGGLAVGSHVLLPDRSLVRLRQRAGELLKAEIDYAATVIRAFVHPLVDAEAAMSAAWERTLRARSAFEAASGSASADASSVRRWLTYYRAGLNAITGSCATLETLVPSAHTKTLDRRFIVAVDDYVDALRGEAPRAGQAWTVDATHLVATEAQLRESAALLDKAHVAQRVLVAEVETITRHLMTIADVDA